MGEKGGKKVIFNIIETPLNLNRVSQETMKALHPEGMSLVKS